MGRKARRRVLGVLLVLPGRRVGSRMREKIDLFENLSARHTFVHHHPREGGSSPRLRVRSSPCESRGGFRVNFPRKLESAINLARASLGRSGKAFTLAAVGVRADGANVVSVNGWNVDVEPKHHAEGRVVRKLDVGAVLYIARVKKDGTVAMAKPCPACQALLRSRRVSEVHFTIDEGSWGTMKMR